MDSPFLTDLPATEALIEFTDEQDRPLLIGPQSEAVRLGLRHRVVGVLFYEAPPSGRRQRVYVRRRDSGLWDLSSTTHVRVGESRESAARRALISQLFIREPEIHRLAECTLSENQKRLQVTLFTARSSAEYPAPVAPETQEGLFLDADELEALVRECADLLTPALLWVFRAGWLFLPRQKPPLRR